MRNCAIENLWRFCGNHDVKLIFKGDGETYDIEHNFSVDSPERVELLRLMDEVHRQTAASSI
jgi:hypothetical protein